MANLSELDNDGLTDEERAALAEGDDAGTDTHAEGEGGEQSRDDGAGADTDEEAEAKAKAEEEAAAAAKVETDAAAAEAAKAAEQTADTTTTAAAAPVNTLIADAQAEVDAKQKALDEAKAATDAALKEIEDKKAKLDQDVEDGEITMVEFRKKLDELQKQERDTERSLDKQERELEFAQNNAKTLGDQERNRGKAEWDAQCGEFLDAHDEYRKDNDKMQTLNSYVITIAKAEPKLTGPQILAKAHSIVSGEPLAKPAASKDAAKPVTTKKPELVPNLSKLPAAESTDTDGDGRWAALDRLQTTDYDAYEKKISEMSEADRDAYLRA